MFSLLCIIYNDHPLPVETFVDFIHNNVKSFSLHINEINNLKLEGKANDGRDTFSFTRGYNANIVAKNYQDNEYHKIQVSVNFNNNKVWFTQFGGVFQEQEIKGILYHYGLLLVDLKSESDQFITSKIKTDDEPEYTTNSDYLQSLGSYPSTLFYQYIKDLQISNNPNA